MITICIPVFNFNITSLINELSNQMQSFPTDCEIIVIDDCSMNFKNINRSVCKNVTYIELSENIGRARIRNLFLKYAKFEYLLFLDCDSLIYSTTFLLKYMETISQKPQVVCGGRVYDATRPERNKKLRWKYGILKESQPCSIRQKFPNKSFMTNNFLIQKQILQENKFEERLTKYGHEDTLFGFQLKRKNITITHIENPILNGDIETNSDFLHKTEAGVSNLVSIMNLTDYNNELTEEITILKFYKKIKKLETFIRLSFKILKPFIKFLLTKGFVSLLLFDFYKLGIFLEKLKVKS